MPPDQIKKAILEERRQRWENSLWQAEKVDLPVARKIGDKQMESNAVNAIKQCQTALAIIAEIEQELAAETKETPNDPGQNS